MAEATGPGDMPMPDPQSIDEHDLVGNMVTSRSDLDKDTCRICRSEGTVDDPLFYPCKCSGSIQHVHQQCLMDWLSHSNKKHCELCKTSFRFTKLYDPNTPETLPLGVFLARACLHIADHIKTWLRAALVGLIWLVILPWAVRWAWRGLFYMMDAGWAREAWIAKLTAETRNRGDTVRLAHNATSQTRNAFDPELWVGPMYASFLLGAWNVISGPWKSSKSAANQSQDTLLNTTANAASSTLLSDLDLAQTFTTSPTVNRAILDVLEGQVITVVVVAAFILVFLIREWVIQQQPILNAAAHVREAEQQLARVERARQALRDEIRLVEEQLEKLNNSELAPGISEQGNEARGSSAADVMQFEDGASSDVASTTASSPIDWTGFVRNVQETSENWIAEDQTRLPESVILIRTLTEEVVAIIAKVKDGQVSDVDAFGQLIDWVRKIPPDVDSSWLSELATVFSQLRSLRESSNIAEEETRQTAEGPLHPPTVDETQVPENWDDDATEADGADNPSGERLNGEQPEEDVHQQEQRPPVEQPGEAQEAEQLNYWTPAESDVPGHASEVALLTPGPSESSSTGGEAAPNNEADQQVETPGESPTSELAVPPTPARSPSSGSSRSQNEAQPKHGVLSHMYDFFWGEIDTDLIVVEVAQAGNGNHADAQVAELVDIGDIPAQQHNDDLFADADAQDPEVRAAAAEAGLDAEAIDEAEDLEGILELIGMQGPIAVLFQTALFCGVLVTVTLWGAVGGPYLFGKLALQISGDPVLFFVILPLRAISGLADFVLDLVIFVGGAFGFGCLLLAHRFANCVRTDVVTSPPTAKLEMLESAVVKSFERAATYLASIFSVGAGTGGTDSYFLLASLQAHHALIAMKSASKEAFWLGYTEIASLLNSSFTMVLTRIWDLVRWLVTWTYKDIYGDFRTVFGVLSKIKDGRAFSLTINHAKPIELDPVLSYWSGTDRVLTMLMGYGFLALLGLAFVLRREPLFSSSALQKVEKSITDILRQAGGVIKVILIISIEMLLFPLYCGMLLDFALMPLFDGVTLDSRIDYAQNKPVTFMFLHWFLGTAYMFNFALFVSMCRRILRSGVLYFIRDPDDPTFHPVRDVLERSISTQLRKIAFSGFVYGLMVILCLGGIVWGLASAGRSVFPLRWANPDPVLEFPLEFLFYNFLSPFLFKLMKPNHGMDAAYEWWLRKCARRLRLSHFLFGVRKIDEERSSASQTAEGVDMDGRQGRYVRVPASDQVRVQRGQPVFVPVTEEEVTKDEAEQECSLHGRPNQRFRNVYIPPWFRVRLLFFLCGLWVMCATIGISFTIAPLLLGRGIFALLMPQNVEVNDIWAYSIGIHILATTMFVAFKGREMVNLIRDRVAPTSTLVTKLTYGAKCALKSLYVYGFVAVLIPLLAAVLMQLFLVIPARTYLQSVLPRIHSDSTSPNPSNATAIFGHAHLAEFSGAVDNILPMHHIYLIPESTLGLVLVRCLDVVARSTWTLSAALRRQLTRDGALNPDARLATRAIVLPALLLSTLALLAPLLLAAGIVHVLLPLLLPVGVVVDKVASAKIYRYAFPVVLAQVLAVWAAFAARKGVGRWRDRIRDEVYLVGERLHNFGEKRPPDGSKVLTLGKS